MSDWRLIVSSPLPGAANMELDLRLFRDHEKGLVPPALRIYSWQPKCISLGYSQKIYEEIDLARAQQLGYDVVGRPTGGGIVFHNEAEVTYSLVIGKDDPLLPAGLVPSYKKISEAIVCALNNFGINAEILNSSFVIRHSSLCFSYPAEYEVVAGGKKIVGSAQKRGRRSLLQQGSLFVRPPSAEAFSLLKKPHAGHDAVSLEELLGRPVGFDELKEALVAGFREGLGVRWRAG
ncbi:MAG: lipoate--protein ligase family protein [Candidatus Saganbacteria bacterium]|nr:lipoate--protein ligase family protein [Candidatus Saganbacteria bacterium]